MGVMAKKGETVTCENGHFICNVAKDISSGETVSISQFEEWRPDIGELKSHSPIPNCPECGEKFIRENQYETQLHAGGVWRGSGEYANLG